MLTSLRRKAVSFEGNAFLRLRALANVRLAERARKQRQAPRPEHLLTGERGEELALFYLRTHGYTVAARRWRSVRLRGDLDLVAWDGETLVIFEVKTRTARDLAPAETAVDPAKRRILSRMATAYLQHLPEPWRDLVRLRFDVLSIYDLPGGAEFEHIASAFGLQLRRS